MALSMKSAMVQRPALVSRVSRSQAARAAVPRRQVPRLAAIEHSYGPSGGVTAMCPQWHEMWGHPGRGQIATVLSAGIQRWPRGFGSG